MSEDGGFFRSSCLIPHVLLAGNLLLAFFVVGRSLEKVKYLMLSRAFKVMFYSGFIAWGNVVEAHANLSTMIE